MARSGAGGDAAHHRRRALEIAGLIVVATLNEPKKRHEKSGVHDGSTPLMQSSIT
jgi:hypothetical protein